ncbi:MAG: endonuclease III [Candidatus Caldatribacteriaceae bacterium]
MEREQVTQVLSILEEHFPEARLLLEFRNPFELLVATILAAQAKDERVNQVTKVLFGRFPDPAALAQAPQEEIEEIIGSLSYYRQKARFIKQAAGEILERFRGEVPTSVEALTQLPGVGKKTANIVLANAFHLPAIAVDTHVSRVAQRLRLSTSSSPEVIERDLQKKIPREKWIRATHLLGFLGRFICHAKRPFCVQCPIRDFCPYPSASSPNLPKG